MKTLWVLFFGILTSLGANGAEAIVGRKGGVLGYFNGTAGWTFQTTTNLAVTALGSAVLSFHENPPPMQIGLWNSQGQLLASRTVTTNSPLTEQTRYESIEPVFLSPLEIYHLGAYADGATTIIAGYSSEAGGVVKTSPEILLRGHAGTVGGFLMPLELHGADGAALIGPNFQFTTIPEPATWHVLIGGLAAGFFIRRLGRRNT